MGLYICFFYEGLVYEKFNMLWLEGVVYLSCLFLFIWYEFSKEKFVVVDVVDVEDIEEDFDLFLGIEFLFFLIFLVFFLFVFVGFIIWLISWFFLKVYECYIRYIVNRIMVISKILVYIMNLNIKVVWLDLGVIVCLFIFYIVF